MVFRNIIKLFKLLRLFLIEKQIKMTLSVVIYANLVRF